MAFSIQKSERNGVPILHLVGMLMDNDVYWFSREMKALLKSGAIKAVIDLTQTEFIDSHGLGLLVYHYTAMQKEGKQLIILNENKDPYAYINGLLQTTGLINLLRVDTCKTF